MNLSDYFTLSAHSKTELDEFYTFLLNRVKDNNPVPYGLLVQCESPSTSDVFIKYLQMQSSADGISDYYTLFHVSSGQNPGKYNQNSCIYVINADFLSDVNRLNSLFHANPKPIKIIFATSEIIRTRLSQNSELYFRSLPKHITIWEPDHIAVFNRFLAKMAPRYPQISEEFKSEMLYYVETVYNDNPEITDEELFVTDLCNRVERKMAEGKSLSYYVNNELGADLVPYSKKVQDRKAVDGQKSDFQVTADTPTETQTLENWSFEDETPSLAGFSDVSTNTKNVLLLALSAFSGEKDSLNRPLLKPSLFSYSGSLIAKQPKLQVTNCYYQLDPIPKLLRTLNIPLDKVIVLATNTTKAPIDIAIAGGNSYSAVSPLSFFQTVSLHNSFRESQAEASTMIIDLDEYAPQSAIQDAAKAIQELAGESSLNLYIDNHGGFRDIQMITEAITTLIATPQIHTHFFNVRYSNREKYITDDTSTQIFDLVSGVKELSLYGRMESLSKYANGSSPKLVQPLNAIAESILWCDAEKFFPEVMKLKNYFDNPASPSDTNNFIALFEKQVYNDFEPLFKTIDKYNELDAIATMRWCIKKGLYQQAITVLESKMADTLCHRGIIEIDAEEKRYSNNDLISLKTLFDGCVFSFHQGRIGGKWVEYRVKSFNNALRNYTFSSNNLAPICKLFPQKKGQTLETEEQISLAYTSSVVDKKPSDSKDTVAKNLIIKNVLRVPFERLNKQNSILYNEHYLALFILHAIMKVFRNNTNHMLGNDFETAAVKNALDAYINIVEELTKAVS